MQSKENELGEWPAEDLEDVASCPVCDGRDGTKLYQGLTDNVFFSAPGRWTFYRCTSCHSAYLNPRPTQKSIGRAYQRYYTHEQSSSESCEATLSFMRRVRRGFANGYINRRFGANRPFANLLGPLLALALTRQRRVIDVMFRYLPNSSVKGSRLLDVGCGNGAFLDIAREAGWTATGLEPDVDAAKLAQGRGHKVLIGSVEDISLLVERYHAVTLSHVIEHVPHPQELLQRVFELLLPGGHLFVDTPNIDGLGSRVFREKWRGLETPRHLAIFNTDSLVRLLEVSGFTNIAVHPRADVRRHVFLASRRMAAGLDPYARSTQVLSPKLEFMCRFVPNSAANAEFVTITANKPLGPEN